MLVLIKTYKCNTLLMRGKIFLFYRLDAASEKREKVNVLRQFLMLSLLHHISSGTRHKVISGHVGNTQGDGCKVQTGPPSLLTRRPRVQTTSLGFHHAAIIATAVIYLVLSRFKDRSVVSVG